MPPLKQNQIPRRRHHRASGRDVVTLSGREIPLGKHDSPEAIEKYNELIARWLANGRKLAILPEKGMTVGQLIDRFMAHAATYYRKRGQLTGSYRNYQLVTARLRDLFGSIPAEEFRPSSYKTCRESWVRAGAARSSVNLYGQLIRSVFGWGVAEELVPASVCHALREVPPLAKGRTQARETEPVGCADPASVEAIMGKVEPKVAAMIRFQILTACRPTETCSIRLSEIDRTGPVWIYRPGCHKTEHHDRSRAIAIGPQAQAILSPWIERSRKLGKDWPIFGMKRQPKTPIDRSSYHERIIRAARQLGVKPFAPNQLRHSGLTAIRARFGIEAAQVIADHSDVATTSIYAENNDLEKKIQIARDMG